ncbi:hypothetical protein B7463_g845, partial [Scytalidium lignicola]
MSGNVQASDSPPIRGPPVRVKSASSRLQFIEERLSNFNRPYVERFDYKLCKIDAREVQLDPVGAPSADFAFFTPYQGNLPDLNDPRIEAQFLPYDENDPALKHRKDIPIIQRTRALLYCLEC